VTSRPARVGHDARIFLLALGAGLPALVVALVLLWRGQQSLKVEVTLTAFMVGVWLALAARAHTHVVRPLHTITNLLASVREGDFTVRARPGQDGELLGAAFAEINAIGATVREQRLGALEANALLAKVMLEIDVAIFAFDAQGQLRLANRAGERLLGRPPGQLIGTDAATLGMADLLSGETPRTLTLPLPQAGGAGHWELRRTSFRQHGLAHELVVLTNLQRALRAEERQAWQRLVRVLGHEINNSLTPISAITASLRASLQRQPRAADWESDLDRALEVVGRRADGLSRFMIAYACLAKLPQPRLAPVDVGRWIMRVASLDPRLPVAILPGPPMELAGDGDQLDQLLINLVRNAVDASLEVSGGVAGAGTVTITWQRRNATLCEIVVQDNGPGIAEASNLFVPFFTTKPGGSGIGLVLSRQIAEAHQGTLDLRNRDHPRGCEAILRLPV
jgi:two-component system nitrogen regulation sensor histidine kinase NtrY